MDKPTDWRLLSPKMAGEIHDQFEAAAREWKRATTPEEQRVAVLLSLDAAMKLARVFVGADLVWPLIGLSGALADLDRGSETPLLKRAAPGKKPPAPTIERVPLGAACACVDVLAKTRGVAEAERYVARRLGLSRGAFKSERKRISASRRKDDAARMTRGDLLRLFQQQDDPVAAVEIYLASVSGK